MPASARYLAFLALAPLLGCGPSLSTGGARLVLVRGEPVPHECAVLGAVEASGRATGYIETTKNGDIHHGPTASDNALIKLRNRAAERGATHLRVVETRTIPAAPGGVDRAVIRGIAFRCPKHGTRVRPR